MRNTNDAMQSAGIFEDIQTLNNLKTKLNTTYSDAQALADRQIEIPIEQRRSFRDAGVAATKSDLVTTVSKPLEDASLASLAKSREYTALANLTNEVSAAISQNVAQIEQRIAAEDQRDRFILEQKTSRLNTLEKAASDFMTEAQKVLLEEQKQNNALQMEQLKFTNQMRSDLLKQLAQDGVSDSELSRLLSATPAELLAYRGGNKVLTQSQIASMTSASQIADNIENMLNNSQGLQGSVGTYLGSTNFNPLRASEVNLFRDNLSSFVSQKSLDYIADLKSRGASLGALSEKELGVLQSIASGGLGIIRNKDGTLSGRSNLSEETFRTNMEAARFAAMR